MSRSGSGLTRSSFRVYHDLLLDGSTTVKRKYRKRSLIDSEEDDNDILESYGELCRDQLTPYQPRAIAGHPIVSLDYAATWYPHVRSRYNVHTRGIPCAHASRVIADMTLDPVYPEKFIQAIQGRGMIDVWPELSGLQVFRSNVNSYYHQDCIKPRPRHSVYDSVKVDEIVQKRALPRAVSAPPPSSSSSSSSSSSLQQPPSSSRPLVYVDSSLSSFVRKSVFVPPNVHGEPH